MKAWRLAFPAVLISLLASPAGNAQQAVYLVRHADRLDDTVDTPLSGTGEARAASLAALLRDAGITAIYTSEFQRTMKTAQPLATALKLTPVTVPARDLDALVKRVKESSGNDVVLIVGHDRTVPDILKAFGHAGEVSIGSTEYDKLFVLMPTASGAPVVLRLRY
jgi:broad specificity phosphatase PhoE